MEVPENKLFHLTKENIDRVRYIKLDKKASHSENAFKDDLIC